MVYVICHRVARVLYWAVVVLDVLDRVVLGCVLVPLQPPVYLVSVVQEADVVYESLLTASYALDILDIFLFRI